MRNKEYDRKKLGTLLESAMNCRCMTQQQLAQRLGVTQVTIHNWLHGYKFPKDDKLFELCELLDIDIKALRNANMISINSLDEEWSKAQMKALMRVVNNLYDLNENELDRVNSFVLKIKE